MKMTFDAVAWMRRRRAEIDKEDEGRTWEERGRKTVAPLEGNPRWERLKKRVKATNDAEHTASEPIAVSDKPR